MIDLRSDTVTQPSAQMREAMVRAQVGDDVFGEDPTVNAFEEQVAALLGKERALFVTSGTMANQLAVALHTERGDEVIVGEGAHLAFYESGAAAALSGVQFAVAGSGGMFTPDELEAAEKPRAYYCPRTSLVALEHTHNRAGGRVWPLAAVAQTTACAHARGLRTHLDGARLWNAAIALQATPREVADGFDTVAVCFSKGLGAPAGSILAGPAEAIVRARRLRKMWGGGMRQVGLLAAGAKYALEQHYAALAIDHAQAQLLAAAAQRAGFVCALPQTNLVMLGTRKPAEQLAQSARAHGLALSVFGPRTLRLVTHRDLTDAMIASAAERLHVLGTEDATA